MTKVSERDPFSLHGGECEVDPRAMCFKVCVHIPHRFGLPPESEVDQEPADAEWVTRCVLSSFMFDESEEYRSIEIDVQKDLVPELVERLKAIWRNLDNFKQEILRIKSTDEPQRGDVPTMEVCIFDHKGIDVPDPYERLKLRYR